MALSIRGSLLLTVGLLFCILGCARDRANVLIPEEISPPTEVHETVDVKMSFEENLFPILTARCALAGCHVADGPHGLDFRTYESFMAGGEHPAFIPGNAAESPVVKEITSGRMPPEGPPLSAAEIQRFVDWINQQDPHDDIVAHDDAHDDDMDDAHDAHHEDQDMDDAHDDEADDLHDMDEDHDDDDDDNGHDDDNHDDDN